MAKLMVAVSALILAGSVQAAGWRALRIDGSNEAAFEASVASMQRDLPWIKARMFEMAMQDLWTQGALRAKLEDREYTAEEYFRQLDGLGFQEILSVVDSSGEKAKRFYREARGLLAALPRATSPLLPASPSVGTGFDGTNYNNQGFPPMWEQNHP